MNGSLAIVESKINWRLRSLSKGIIHFPPTCVFYWFFLWSGFCWPVAQIQHSGFCTKHHFPMGRVSGPESIQSWMALCRWPCWEMRSLCWAGDLGSKKSWQPGFPESQTQWPGSAPSHRPLQGSFPRALHYPTY